MHRAFRQPLIIYSNLNTHNAGKLVRSLRTHGGIKRAKDQLSSAERTT
jgi:hypothetical protein